MVTGENEEKAMYRKSKACLSITERKKKMEKFVRVFLTKIGCFYSYKKYHNFNISSDKM